MEMPIRLTETVKKGGCAAKLPAGILRQALAALTLQRPPDLRVGIENLDDAALWDLRDGRYLIQTVDFFTPIVDDPVDFGRIAAANALSDVYAMGGEPATALTILAFPTQTLPLELIDPLLRGATEKIHEAGAALVGGHSIDDDTLKLGFSVAGFVAQDRAWTNAGAREGDVLILTKALGTGTITSALKSNQASPAWVEAAVESMVQLNRVGDLLGDIRVHAATDITGFGLAGHALQMARASGVAFRLYEDAIPALPGARDALTQRILNRAHKSNAAYVEGAAHFRDPGSTEYWLAVDPQTSGGLLLAVAPEDAVETVERLRPRFPRATGIGCVEAKPDDGIWLRFPRGPQ